MVKISTIFLCIYAYITINNRKLAIYNWNKLSCILFYFIIYNKAILLGIISKLYNIQGTKIIKAITIGNSIVQQKDIN